MSSGDNGLDEARLMQCARDIFIGVKKYNYRIYENLIAEQHKKTDEQTGAYGFCFGVGISLKMWPASNMIELTAMEYRVIGRGFLLQCYIGYKMEGNDLMLTDTDEDSACLDGDDGYLEKWFEKLKKERFPLSRVNNPLLWVSGGKLL